MSVSGYLLVSLICSNSVFFRAEEEVQVTRIVNRMFPEAASVSATAIGQIATITITIPDIKEFIRRADNEPADEPADEEPADGRVPDTDRSPLGLALLRSIAPYSSDTDADTEHAKVMLCASLRLYEKLKNNRRIP